MTAPVRGQASIGDALIFVTKALFATVALIVVAVTAYAVLATQTETTRQLTAARAQLVANKDTIADLGYKLNQCLVRVSGGALPMPPEGFVIDQPKP
jgi:hypothetical protein